MLSAFYLMEIVFSWMNTDTLKTQLQLTWSEFSFWGDLFFVMKTSPLLCLQMVGFTDRKRFNFKSLHYDWKAMKTTSVALWFGLSWCGPSRHKPNISLVNTHFHFLLSFCPCLHLIATYALRTTWLTFVLLILEVFHLLVWYVVEKIDTWIVKKRECSTNLGCLIKWAVLQVLHGRVKGSRGQTL